MKTIRHLFRRALEHRRQARALDAWWLDAKLGLRMLVKYPKLALIGGVGMAVGVAIAAGAYSIIYGNFLPSSLPIEASNRLVSIELWDSVANKPEPRILREFQTWRQELKSVSELGAFRTITPNLIVNGAPPESVRVASISASGFRIARVQPLMGRYLEDSDEREGAPFVVVIGESVWRNRFAADPAILRRTMQLGATTHSIVGVMPESFAFPLNHRIWTPLRTGLSQAEPLGGPGLMIFGRLAPNATIDSAQAELAILGRHAAAAFPKIYTPLRPQVLPYPNPFLGLHGAEDASGLFMMNVIVAMLLVLVCLNVSILVYTRTAMRHAEIALRTALGASRSRIVAQLFIEAFVLATASAAVGVALAEFGLRQIKAATQHIASELPFWLSFHLSLDSILYAGFLSVLAAAIVGIVPALKATRGEVQTGLRVISAGGSGMRLGKTWTLLVVAQAGFAVALLPEAIFTTWENLRAELADPGIPAGEFLTAELGMDLDAATPSSSAELARRYAMRQTELMRRLETEPRISTVTFAMSVPGDERTARMETQGVNVSHTVRFNRVGANFFRALDVPILAGRGFELSDAVETGAVIVNQSFAQRVLGGDALGKRIRYSDGEQGRWYEVVGIVKDFPAGVSPGMNDSQLKVYHAASPGQSQPLNLAVRVRGVSPTTFTQRLPELAAAVDPDLYLRNIVTLQEALRKEQWIRRMEAAVLGAVSIIVLLLASAGIYALMSFTVSQRQKEIGIRMALGADRRRIVTSIFARALAQLAAGVVLGTILATLLHQANTSVRPGDPFAVLPSVALFIMAVGILAAVGPARRCLRIEPTEALRDQ